jgi:preprotein translocase subunit SecD
LKNVSWQLVSVIVVVVATIIYLVPTLKPGVWPHKKINLGLDLQGGMHLILEVDARKAVESTVERIAQEIREMLKKKLIRDVAVDRIEGTKISAQVKNEENIEKFNALLDDDFRDLVKISEKKDNGSLSMILGLTDKDRNRIDQFGVSEPDIVRQGENQILIQLPGIKDTERAKELIGKTALLEFKLVDDTHSVEDALKGNVPPGDEILYKVEENPATHRSLKTPYLLKKRTLLTGEYLTDARFKIDSRFNEPYVSISFDKKGARIFERITADNVNKRLAIVLDQNVYSAPVNILEERSVGPSLGADSIRKGLLSMCIGGFLVVAFMVIYYKISGLIADLALVLNIMMIGAGLAAFQATLTLPGMAGIILTIGMAVDANVIIFERVREELALGRTARAAIDAGYNRATLTILDANVTTLIAAVVLFQFGTGPVKGFAVTLSLGVIASLFTALIVSRLIFNYLLMYRQVKTLSI